MGFQISQYLKVSIRFLILFSIITGLIYTGIISLVAELVFPWQANGSLIIVNDKIVGSKLIGQEFRSNKYFWGRPSPTQPYPYNATSSSGSNLGPSNPLLIDRISKQIQRFKTYNPQINAFISIDLLTSSASGLDPDISIEGASLQVDRLSAQRNIPKHLIRKLIKDTAKYGYLSVFSVNRVSVLDLNIGLDNLVSNQEQP